MIKLVEQKDMWSCAICCAAMVAGISWEEAVEESPVRGTGLTPMELDILLGNLGLEFERYMLPAFKACDAHILTVPSLNLLGGGHYVVADTSDEIFKVYDPQYGKKGKKFYARDANDETGIQISSYCEVIRIIRTKTSTKKGG